MQIKQIERGEYPKPKLDYIPLPCMHCQEAPCIEMAKEVQFTGGGRIVIIDPVKARVKADCKQLPLPGYILERREAATSEV